MSSFGATLIIIVVTVVVKTTNTVGARRDNNVCRTFPDYAAMTTNKNCWYNPDADSSLSLIAKRYGYPLDKHRAVTEDGYIITLHRIPHDNKNMTIKRQPIVLFHGIAASSAIFMIRGPDSLAFVLSRNGYDVWLVNFRGNVYSSMHKWMKRSNPNFWNFGFEELALYDIPAVIETVANVTGQTGNIIYVGHSMGTTSSYIYSSMKSEHANKYLKGLISLAPVTSLGHAKGILGIIKPYLPAIMGAVEAIGIRSLFSNDAFTRALMKSWCGRYPGIIFCHLLDVMSTGYAPDQVRPDILPVVANVFPTAISLRTLKHFAQNCEGTGSFRRFNYGVVGNMEKYNSTYPPDYEIEKIALPVYLFIGTKDVVGGTKDREKLYSRLRSRKNGSVTGKYMLEFAHNDFYLGRNTAMFHDKLIEVIKTRLKPSG